MMTKSLPKIYLYSRISSLSQQSGTGLQQQRNQQPLLSELSHRYSLPISNETFEDIGVSAYKGNHLQASFGKILDAISSGRIAKGSILVVFSLDRISRQQVNLAMELFLSVINKGVSIYTTSDNMLYDHNDEHISQNIILSVLTMQRAHEESRTKSKRTRGNALTIIKGIEANDPAYFQDGYTRAIKSVGSHPWWLDISSGYVKPHPKYFPIARAIVKRIINLESTITIFRWLEKNYDAPPRSRGKWNPVLIDKMTANTMLTGKRILTIDGSDYNLPNYAPAVCSEKDFDLLRATRSGKYKKDNVTKPKVTGLLNGINTLKCGICGGGMSCNRSGKYYRYACINAANGTAKHPQWGTPIEPIENYITQQARLRAFNNIAQPASDNLKSLLQNQSDLTSQLEQLEIEYQEYRADGLRPPRVLVAELSDLESQLEQIQESIDAERITTAKGTLPNVWRSLFTDYAEADFLDKQQVDLRLQFRNVLRHMIDRIEAKPTGRKDGNRNIIEYVVKWSNGDTTVTSL
ncbi:recombinase family protein [Vibrio owensii]|uniref:Resolvase/invertase-type recombinase catalytic domain-containing protein n=2 Tax=Vibrio owensii TaxID=696485 RepID=A0A0C1ZLU1_9VIBR|nr:recombinase family protein [Vibrio owensii]KIF54076.1 hypothetical protein H735_06720 [Vibrio owensii CAIM 1854 = LMG 25443]